jgi:hypothetical protein
MNLFHQSVGWVISLDLAWNKNTSFNKVDDFNDAILAKYGIAGSTFHHVGL